jgi:hypothetical protein
MVAPLALVSVLAGIGRHSLILCVPADRTRDHRELLHKTLKHRTVGYRTISVAATGASKNTRKHERVRLRSMPIMLAKGGANAANATALATLASELLGMLAVLPRGRGHAACIAHLS